MIVDEGVALIWVLEQGPDFEDGTAANCEEVISTLGSDLGYCVGDDQSKPEIDVFDDSALANERGFDILVDRSSMQIIWASTHGTSAGDENPTGKELLEIIQKASR